EIALRLQRDRLVRAELDQVRQVGMCRRGLDDLRGQTLLIVSRELDGDALRVEPVLGRVHQRLAHAGETCVADGRAGEWLTNGGWRRRRCGCRGDGWRRWLGHSGCC